MTPITFQQSNRQLLPPDGMKNCVPLPVWTDGRMCVSCWRPSWRERLSMLCFGRLWVYVHSGSTQPPIALSGRREIFTGQAEARHIQAEDTQ